MYIPAACHIIYIALFQIDKIALVFSVGQILYHFIIFSWYLPLFKHLLLFRTKALFLFCHSACTIRKIITDKHIKVFIDACPYFRTYFLYPVLLSFGYDKVYPVVMLFDMSVLIRCSIHENTAFFLITALYKSLTQDTRFLCSRLCATCVLYVCYASKFSTFYYNFRKHKHKENP